MRQIKIYVVYLLNVVEILSEGGKYVIQNFTCTSPNYFRFACKTRRSTDFSRLNEWSSR